MHLWCDGAHDPAENMRRDAALLEAASHAPAGGAVLRLFRFSPHGITLGYAQRPERELDLERCRGAGVPWAVRPTGGRAIFHAEEWTYSLAASLDDPDWGGSLSQAYGAISELLVRSMTRLGVPARHAPAAPHTALLKRRTPVTGESVVAEPRGVHESLVVPETRPRVSAAAPCFSSTARHEVILDGRKLIGSAQRRTARALLQQGSLLLGSGHVRLIEFLAISERERPAARAALSARAIGAHAYLGDHPPLERWAAALADELPGVCRVDGAAGLFLLTPPESASYTAPVR